MRLLHGSNVEIENQRITYMDERYLKFENLMADLAAYLVSVYDIEPRDAVGLVMNNPLTQELYSSEEPITGQEVKALAEELLSVG